MGPDRLLPEDEAAALSPLATVIQADAEAAALAAVSGEIVQTELDNENGFVVWSIEIRDAADTVHDVKIDAGNAAVLGIEAGEDGAAE
ncbi:MAG: PepSY domain-containing protein [Chloroflexota bacterium]